jgi:hypothetical protein
MKNSSKSESPSDSFIVSEEIILPKVSISLISKIAFSFSKVISNNELKFYSHYILDSPFTSNPIPLISTYDYLNRICHYTNISKETLICAIIYIDNICSTNKAFLCEFTIHKLLLASIILSIKFNEEQMYSMNYYAEVFGVSTKELHNLELSFISMINFSLFIKEEKYYQYEQSLINLKIDNNLNCIPKNNIKHNEHENDEEEISLNLSDRNTMSSYDDD